jgi:hypothetical protein
MSTSAKQVGFIGNPSSLSYRSKNNTGNIIHGYAARVIFRDPGKASTELDDANIEKVRSECSHIGFVTATMLHPARAPAYVDSYAHTADFIEKAGLPVCTFGLGCHASLTQTVADANLDAVTIRLLHVVSAHSKSIAVRGPFTADLCAKYGVKNTEVVGCQSTYISGADNWETKTDIQARVSRPVANFSLRPDESHVLRLIMNSGSDIIAQDDATGEAVKLGEMSKAQFVSKETWKYPFLTKMFEQGKLAPEHYYDYLRDHFHKFYNVSAWTKHIRDHYDFSFGTRFHGNMAAFMAGVPAVWLVHDMRTKELCEHLSLPHVDHSLVKDFDTVADLAAACSFQPFWSRFPQRLNEFMGYLERNGVSPLLKPAFVSKAKSIIATGTGPDNATHRTPRDGGDEPGLPSSAAPW